MKQSKNYTSLNYIICGFVLLFFLSACKKKDPKVCFYVRNFIAVDEVVSFQNCSENYNRVEWDFTDGTSSTIASPTHKWEKKGFFETNLTIYKGDKAKKTSQKIFVGLSSNAYITANFTNWKIDGSQYDDLFLDGYVFRSDGETYQYMGHAPFSGNINTSYDFTFLKGFSIKDDKTSFRIRIQLYGHKKDEISPPSTLIDYFDTEEINIYNSSELTGSAEIMSADVSYSISPMIIY